MSERGEWMQTYTGRAFYPLDPRPEDVCISDIAHALAHQCRFGGHCREFYSVAEHCVLLSWFVPENLRLWALLHDAAEAYLVDVPRPIKPMLAEYRDIEARIMTAVAARFGLLGGMPQAVKDADLRILNDERVALMTKPPGPWETDYVEPLGVRPFCWEPRGAELRFLHEFDRYTVHQERGGE